MCHPGPDAILRKERVSPHVIARAASIRVGFFPCAAAYPPDNLRRRQISGPFCGNPAAWCRDRGLLVGMPSPDRC